MTVQGDILFMVLCSTVGSTVRGLVFCGDFNPFLPSRCGQNIYVGRILSICSFGGISVTRAIYIC
jgi:hypothetical protein